MTPSPPWARIQDVFARVIEREPGERADFLRQACGEDADLLLRVSELVEAHEALEAGEGTLPEALDPALATALLEEASGELQPGDLVGRYRIIRPAGRGGMGVVYLAHDPRLDRPVALKLLPRWRTADPAANRRLEEEARAASALDHPHIATVYEVGESAEGRRYIAMGWYEGGTLRDRLRDAPLPVEAAVGIARQLADGLAAAHASGIVHRDVKPENVAFGRGGRALILDFGLASPSGQTSGRGTPGTAAYMSPEQARGEGVDHRSDLWALGVVLYEMLTASRPFGEAAVAGGPPHTPLRRLRPDVPPPLAEVVERCLRPDPAERFPSADALLAALRGLENSALRRPLFQAAPVLAYVLLSGVVFAAAWGVARHYLLPEWFTPSVLALLLLALPVIAAATFLGQRAGGADRLLTWPRMLGGGLLALGGVAAITASIVASGAPRVTEARGTAGDALGDRPGVLLADFEAAPGVEDVALTVREALAVDLGQSTSVTLLGRRQVARVLDRMGHAPPERLALPLALEVGERAGAGAVLSGSVSRAGGQLVLVGRAFDPETGAELFAVRTAAGERQLLGAVERLSREMRRRLGETPALVRRSRPLPEVTTPSLEALRLYAAAEERLARLDYEQAEALAEEAIGIDPGFAMAHRLAAAAAVSRLSYGRSLQHTARAYEHRDRLTERERRHIEAGYSLHVAFEPPQAVRSYRLLLTRYPDDARGWNNLGATLHSWMGDTEGAYTAFIRATALDPYAGFAFTNAAHMAALAGRMKEADTLARRASALEMADLTPRWRLGRAFAAGDVHTAAALCDSLLAASPTPGSVADDAEICGSIDMATGRVERGMARLEGVTETYLQTGRWRNVAHAAHALAVGHTLTGDPARAADRLEAVTARIPAEGFVEPDRFITRTNLRVHAALLGETELVERIAATYPPYPDPKHWFARFAESLVRAAEAVSSGDGAAALRALDEGRTEGLMPIGWRVWDALLRGLAHEALGDPSAAAPHFRRAAEPGYLLLPYLAKDRVLLPLALAGLARVEDAQETTGATGTVRLERLLALADPEVLRLAP